MLSNIEDELYISIKYEELKQIMMFSNISIEAIDNFFNFHKSDEN